MSTINENRNIANNAKYKGEEAKSKKGDTATKVLFFAFLVPSIAFPIVAIVLSNPWFLIGLVFVAPTGICGYFGFKSSESAKVDLSGGNNPYDQGNADSTMNSTIANAKIKQGNLGQFEQKNAPNSEIKDPNK